MVREGCSMQWVLRQKRNSHQTLCTVPFPLASAVLWRYINHLIIIIKTAGFVANPCPVTTCLWTDSSLFSLILTGLLKRIAMSADSFAQKPPFIRIRLLG